MLPTIGTKELVAWLPTLLGLGPADLVVVPELAYPTYDVGAAVVGAQVLATDALTAAGPARVAPGVGQLPVQPDRARAARRAPAKVVAWARERGAVVVSDECYVELGWDAEPVSVLHPSCLRRLVRRAARGALAVEALQPGGLPGRSRRR